LANFISWLSPTSNVGNFHGSGGEANVQAPVKKELNLWVNFAYNGSVLNARVPPVENISEEQHHVEVNSDGLIYDFRVRTYSIIKTKWRHNGSVILTGPGELQFF
jgi:hypothetical protein